MNLNWILILVSVDAALLAAVLAMAAGMRSQRRDRLRLSDETADLRASLAALRSEVEEERRARAEKDTADEPAAAPSFAVPFVPACTLSADKRAEALEMLRSGMDSGAVSAKLQLSEAEALLLEKIHSLLGPVSDRRQ
jgi:hypothetical protein